MRRLWRILKFALLGVVALLSIVLIWVGVSNWRSNAQYAAKIEELRDRGLPTAMADLKRTPPPREENVVTYLLEARQDVEAIAAAVEAACEAAGDTDEDSAQYDALWAGQPKPMLLQEIRAAFARHPQVIPLLLQASNCPDYDWQYDFDAGTQHNGRDQSSFDEIMEPLGYKRQVYRVMYYNTLLRLDEGNPSEAAAVCQAMLRLAGFYASDPLLVNYFVACAVYMVSTEHALNLVLRVGELPPEVHAELEATLARQDLGAQYRQTLMTERAYSLQCFEEMHSHWPLMAFVWTPAFKKDRLSYAELFDHFSQESELPYDTAMQDRLAVMQAQAGVFTGLVLPALDASLVGHARTHALHRCARVLNQLMAQDPSGEKSLTIEQLGLPPDATTDPFGGQPLRIKHTGNGWLVYSVGKNLKDDGGQLDDDATDVGLGPVSGPVGSHD